MRTLYEPFPRGEVPKGWPQTYVSLDDHVAQNLELASAIECLRDIADMGRKAGSETATNWLQGHGYARTAGGYVPGKGYEGGETPSTKAFTVD